jgi:spermidine synthase
LIKGTIISRCRDRYGEIVVADYEGMRSLYFGDGVLQSCILLDRPEALIMDYSQAMVSALIFGKAPESVLLIGLGGCSLVNFLLRAVPRCSLDVVEIRQQVIKVAREFFLLPGPTGKLKIVCGEGQEFIRGQDRGGSAGYDLILVDAFDDDGPAAPLMEEGFLMSCHGLLNRGGLFVMNVWNRPKDNFPAFFARVCDVFGSNTLKLLLAEAYRNAIVFGFEDPSSPGDLPHYRSEAKGLQREYGINFPMYLRLLYQQNFLS